MLGMARMLRLSQHVLLPLPPAATVLRNLKTVPVLVVVMVTVSIGIVEHLINLTSFSHFYFFSTMTVFPIGQNGTPCKTLPWLSCWCLSVSLLMNIVNEPDYVALAADIFYEGCIVRVNPVGLLIPNKVTNASHLPHSQLVIWPCLPPTLSCLQQILTSSNDT